MDTSKIKELVGYKLVFGIAGPDATPETIALFKETGARGLILYRRNYRSPRQIRKLISDLESALGYRLLVCIDHESGRVIFLGGGVTVFPDCYTFGLLGDVDAVRRQGEIEGRELRALGIDVNFAPVLDTIAEHYNPGILSRSYSKDPAKVALFGKARIEGLQAGGISATAKHFPGKGHTTVDAHLKLPVIDSTLEEMEAFHLKPFMAAIEAGCDCIMSSHPLYRNIDNTPATFSRKIMHDLLRVKYGYKGVIVSDDLEMGALTESGGAAEAIVRAENAGHDLLLVCHATGAQQKAYHALVKAYEDGVCDVGELEASVERIKKLHARRPNRFDGEIGPLPEGKAIAERAANAAATVLQKGALSLPLDLSAYKNKKVALVYPRFSDLSSLLMWEPEVECLGCYFQSRMAGKNFAPSIVPVALSANEEDILRVERVVKDADLSIIFVWDAGLVEGWRKILENTQKQSKACVAILLRDFFDQRFILPETASATAYGFRKCQIDAVLKKLFI